MSSSLSTAGPSHSDAASSSRSSCFMCRLYSGLTKIPKALRTRWETKYLSQFAPSGQVHMSHKTRKIGNIRKKNRQSISELLERKIGNCGSRLDSCLFWRCKMREQLLQRKQVQLSSDISMEGGGGEGVICGRR